MESKFIKAFLSEQNVNRLVESLIQTCNINVNGNNKKAVYMSCRNTLKPYMANVLNAHKKLIGKKEPNGLLLAFNKKSIEKCVEYINKKKNESSNSKQSGNRRARHQSQQDEIQSFQGTDASGGYASFASINGNGQFIAADGSMGNEFILDKNLNDEYGFTNEDKARDIEEKMLHQREERESEFPMQYNPDQYNRREHPKQINFALDGGSSNSNSRYENRNENRNGNGNNFSEDRYDMSGLDMHFDQHYQDSQNYPDSQHYSLPNFGSFQSEGQYNSQYSNGMNGNGRGNANTNLLAQQFTHPSFIGGMQPNFVQEKKKPEQSRQQFILGGTINKPQDNMDTELSRQIEEKRNAVENKLGLKPNQLKNMSSEDIQYLIAKAKSDASDSGNLKTNSVKDTDVEKVKQLLLSSFAKKKKNKSESSDNSDSDKQSSVSERNEQSSDSSDKKSKQVKKKPKIIKKSTKDSKKKSESNKLKEIRIKINSDDLDDPEMYNDYMIDIKDYTKEKLNNVVGIRIENYEIPVKPVIDEKQDQMSIIFDDETYELTLEQGIYTSSMMSEMLNEVLTESIDDGFSVKIKKNRMTISHKSKEFGIEFSEKSVGKLLGFDKIQYSGETTYTAENETELDGYPAYLYILQLSKNKHIATFTTDGKLNQNITEFDKPIDRINKIIIQFKNAITNSSDEDDLYNFYGKSHKFDLVFLTK